MHSEEIYPDGSPLTVLDAVTLAVLVTREVLLLEERIKTENNDDMRHMLDVERRNLMDILRKLIGMEIKHIGEAQ